MIPAWYRQLRNRLDTLISRGVIERVNDNRKTQRVQATLLSEECEDDIEMLQPYGLSFVPPIGSEFVALAVGGARSHTVGLGAGKPGDRPIGANAAEGGLYTSGTYRVFIDEDGVVHLGERVADDYVALAAKVLTELQAIRTWANTHKHTGVTTGSGTSATPDITLAAPASVAATKVKAT